MLLVTPPDISCALTASASTSVPLSNREPENLVEGSSPSPHLAVHPAAQAHADTRTCTCFDTHCPAVRESECTGSPRLFISRLAQPTVALATTALVSSASAASAIARIRWSC
jgi:hypothetical protein